MTKELLSIAAPSKSLANDHRFYSGVALASSLVVFVGFRRTYYVKSLFPLHRRLAYSGARE